LDFVPFLGLVSLAVGVQLHHPAFVGGVTVVQEPAAIGYLNTREVLSTDGTGRGNLLHYTAIGPPGRLCRQLDDCFAFKEFLW
jgi:hypothetical protein